MGRCRSGPPVAVLLCALCALAGCGTATNVVQPVSSPAGASPSRTAPVVPSAPSVRPVPPPSPAPRASVRASPSFSDAYAANCAGHPDASSVVAVLRAEQVISRSASVTATLGPLCAGGWQYTVVSEAGREPLQVVTQGSPTALTLVTAGTEVCTPLVRTQAPPGIIAVAHC